MLFTSLIRGCKLGCLAFLQLWWNSNRWKSNEPCFREKSYLFLLMAETSAGFRSISSFISICILWFLPTLLIFLCALFCWWIFSTWLHLPHNLKWFFFREVMKCPFPQNSIGFCVTRLTRRSCVVYWLKAWIYLTATWMRCKNCEFHWRPKTRGLCLRKLLVFKGIVWVYKFMGF